MFGKKPQNIISISVADTGSDAFLTPESDPGWVKNQDPDPGWITWIIFPRAYKQFFATKNTYILDADPGSGMGKFGYPGWTSRIRNTGQYGIADSWFFLSLLPEDPGRQRAILPGWGAGRSRLDAAQRLHCLCALQRAGLCPWALQHSRPESAGISLFSLWIYGSGSSIFKWIRIRNQDFDGQKLKKRNSGNFFLSFFWPKIAVYFSLGLHKGRPSYKRSLFSPQKKIFSTSKDEIYERFSIFLGNFCPHGAGLCPRALQHSRPESTGISLF